MLAEHPVFCIIHGKLETKHCPDCDANNPEELGGPIDRDPLNGRPVSAEQRQQRMVTALRDAGLSPDQVDLVLHTLANPNSGRVTDEQLGRVLASIQPTSPPVQVSQQSISEDPAQVLRDAGWPEDRIAGALAARTMTPPEASA